jgi:hypothetical protein
MATKTSSSQGSKPRVAKEDEAAKIDRITMRITRKARKGLEFELEYWSIGVPE